jgi:uncharacterized protein (TIGR04255 family)
MMKNHKVEMDLNQSGSLADFKKPPVVETSLGFHFSPLSDWSLVHYGSLWETFKGQYPKPEYRPPILLPGQPMPQPEVSGDIIKMPIRICLVENSDNELVQFQNGCFMHNWRKTDATPQYQHYAGIRPTFSRDWRKFCDFIKAQSLQQPRVSRCEVSYFNHLVRGEDWTEFTELPNIFPAWKGVEDQETLTTMEAINSSISYTNARVKVQFNFFSGVRQTDAKEIIQFTVTTGSKPNGSTDEELFQCLDLCHRSAVLGFLKFTSDQIQKRWGKIQ